MSTAPTGAAVSFLDASANTPSQSILQHARAVVEAEGRAVLEVAKRLDRGYVRSIELLASCRGRVVVTGMGKSGLVGQKISATFASIGAPSLFVHAAEALHGDLGRITGDDVVLALSNSGESEELLRLAQPVKSLGAALIAMTSSRHSSLARQATAVVALGNVVEACPMGLVPTVSTTMMMVLGDALAMGLFHLRGSNPETYARLHPGGMLGRKLMKVGAVMRAGAANPVGSEQLSLRAIIGLMSQTPGRPGAASLVNDAGRLVGFFTDGDLRRLLQFSDFSVDCKISTVMHHHPKTVSPECLVYEAMELLHTHQVDQVPVVDTQGTPIGLLDVQDVLSARLAR